MPPKEYRSISKEALYSKYFDEKWPERLSQYQCQTFQFTRKTLSVWKDGDSTLAVVAKHENPTGTQIVVRLLREGDIVWDIDHQPAKDTSPIKTIGESKAEL